MFTLFLFSIEAASVMAAGPVGPIAMPFLMLLFF